MTILESRSRGVESCPTCGGVLEQDGCDAECRSCRRRFDLLEVSRDA